MRRTTAALLAGLVIGILGTVGSVVLSNSWYDYEMLDPASCASFKQGRFGVAPGRTAPNQPNECYIRTPRIHLP